MFNNKQQAAYYLAALIDGEGTISKHPIHRQASITNTSKDIINAAIECLDILEIDCHYRFYRSRHAWLITICGRSNLTRLFELVPLQDSKKRARLNYAVSSYVHSVPPPRPSRKKLVELYNSGMSVDAIADEFKTGVRIVRRWFTELNIVPRTHSETIRLNWDLGKYDNRMKNLGIAVQQ